MGKAFKWFRGLLGLRKPDPETTLPKPKQKWKFAKSHSEKDKHRHHDGGSKHTDQIPTTYTPVDADSDDHAFAVAAATAAVAEAAVAAAQAAAAVVKLTSSGRCAPTMAYADVDTGIGEAEWAAIKIQAAFRGFLARKALRALRGLVRLQALVRGHIERKRTAEWMQRMQALLRAQARARAGRFQLSELSHSSITSLNYSSLDPATPEKFEHSPHTKSTRFKQMQRTGSRFTAMDVEKIDRILEIENEKTHFHLKPKSLFNSIKSALSSDLSNQSSATSKEPATYRTLPSLSPCETQFLSPMNFSHEVEETSLLSISSNAASTKKSPFTPTKSDSSRSYFSGDSEYRSYMACTESSRAKIRSLSAPRQRPQYERSSSAKRCSVYGFGESRLTAQQVSTLQSNFISKAYPGSGRLDKFGLPVGYRY